MEFTGYLNKKNDFVVLNANDATGNLDEHYDIYIYTPVEEGTFDINKDFGRIYQPPESKET